MISSPLNYTGGKYKLLPQILPLFPREIRTFVDLFCGGCNVGLNVPAEHVIYNDRDPALLALYEIFRQTDRETLLRRIDAVIEAYGLSRTSRDGYAHYGCESSRGVGSYNKVPYLRLRADFNAGAGAPWDLDRAVMLYVLIVYSFNNQIRFNRQGAFNLPVGKRDLNRSMERKLTDFLDRLQTQNCCFTCRDFRDVDTTGLTGQDLVYADPPYLITCAAYNERGGWGETNERDLLALLDRLDRQGVRVALSNVLRSKGRENRILLDWLETGRGRFRAVPLTYSYANSNYHTRDRVSGSEEVLIVNF